MDRGLVGLYPDPGAAEAFAAHDRVVFDRAEDGREPVVVVGEFDPDRTVALLERDQRIADDERAAVGLHTPPGGDARPPGFVSTQKTVGPAIRGSANSATRAPQTIDNNAFLTTITPSDSLTEGASRNDGPPRREVGRLIVAENRTPGAGAAAQGQGSLSGRNELCGRGSLTVPARRRSCREARGRCS